MKAADIIISRAGSLSLSEIIQCGTPCILIPYPHAAQDHQRKNAKEITEKGISLYLDDEECKPKKLLEKVKILINDEGLMRKMSEAAKREAKENPSAQIVKQLKSTIK